jgi:hypothetical protein
MSLDPMQQGQRGLNNLNTRIEAFTTRYLRAEALLTSLVTRAVLAGTLGVPKVRRAVKAQVAAMLEELDKQSIPEGDRLVEKAYQLGIKLAAPEIRKMSSIDDQALALLKENISSRLGDATTHVGRRVDDVFRKEGLRIASLSLGDQEVPNLSDQLQQRLVKQGVSAFTDRNGTNWGLAEYARMAVKTTTAEAIFYGTQGVLIGNGLDVVEVNHVSNPCDLCAKYDGKTFSLTGRSTYPLLDTTFPVHPNCQHYMVVSPKAFADRAAA